MDAIYKNCTNGKHYQAEWVNIAIAVVGIPLLFLGIVGNLYTIVFFLRDDKYGRGFSMIIVALAFFDNLALISAPLRYMVQNLLDCDIRRINVMVCRISFFCVYFNKTMSLLLQVWLIIDRYVIVKYVMVLDIIYTGQIKLYIFFCLLIYSTAKNIGLLLMPRKPITGSFQNFDRTNPCAAHKEHPFHFFLYVITIWHDLIGTFVCGFLIIGFNILVSTYVRKAINASEKNKTTINYIVAIGFLNTIIYLPASINEAIELMGDDTQQSNPTRSDKIKYVLINYTSYMSHGINVILYLIMSQRFRTSVINILSCKCFTPQRTPHTNFSGYNVGSSEE